MHIIAETNSYLHKECEKLFFFIRVFILECVKVEEEREAQRILQRTSGTGSGNQIGKVKCENSVSHTKAEGEILSSAFGICFVEITHAKGKLFGVPVFHSSANIYLAHFFRKSSGCVIK